MQQVLNRIKRWIEDEGLNIYLYKSSIVAFTKRTKLVELEPMKHPGEEIQLSRKD